MSTFDPIKVLEKLTPTKDGEPRLTLRKGVITDVNADGTIDITLSGTAVSEVGTVGDPSNFVVGRTVHLLAATGTLLALGSPGSASADRKPNVYMTFGGSIGNNSLTTLTPTSVPIDDGDLWTSGTNFVVPADEGGLYEMGQYLQYQSQVATVGMRQSRIQVNGTDVLFNPVATTTILNGFPSSASGVCRSELDPGDVITFMAYHNGGAALNLNAPSHGWIERVR